MYTTPKKKIQNHREPPFKLCLKKACLPCPPPSFSLVMGLFSHGSPIVDIHMAKPRLGTGVPRSPGWGVEAWVRNGRLLWKATQLIRISFSSPLVLRSKHPESNVSILYLCPPSFPSQLTCSGYLQWTVLLSRLLLPPPAAPPSLGLIIW